MSVTVPLPPPPPPPPTVSVATSLSATGPAARVVAGSAVQLRAVLRAAGVPLADRTDVSVWKKARSRWAKLGAAGYDAASGSYVYSVTASSSASYQFRFAGDAAYRSSVSNSVAVSVTRKTRTRQLLLR